MAQSVAAALLPWYMVHQRQMPWRVAGYTDAGEMPNPYHVWLSEMMLQQTTVATVERYFLAFIARWPTVQDLAAAQESEVLHAWQGLGYYSRARNLHRAAQIIATSGMPRTIAELETLPGVGAYTARAIAAIAYNIPCLPLDTNIERIISRLYAITIPHPQSRKEIARLGEPLVPPDAAGCFAQALMDLGSSLCKATTPACLPCPLRPHCAAAASGNPAQFPIKAAKKQRPTRRAIAFALWHDGSLLLRTRPPHGLLASMTEIPATPWDTAYCTTWPMPDVLAEYAPVTAIWQPVAGVVRHTFTHFHFEVQVLHATVDAKPNVLGYWVAPDALAAQPLPTVMKKIINHAAGRTVA